MRKRACVVMLFVISHILPATEYSQEPINPRQSIYDLVATPFVSREGGFSISLESPKDVLLWKFVEGEVRLG
ncbi:MAG: hypothetical protein AAB288_05380, partial [Acidobacteriota bacterium]